MVGIDKKIVLGMVLMVLLALAVGYSAGRAGLGTLDQRLGAVTADNEALKERVEALQNQADALRAELDTQREQGRYAPPLETYMFDAIRRSGLEPEALLEDLRSHPEVIPESAVLGGTMGFYRIGLLDDRWVYGSYEDGHIAGAAIFQWKPGASGIVWTPVLVRRD